MILKKDNSPSMANLSLWQAPFTKPLRICVVELPEETQRILLQMGLEAGEIVQKMHAAPLGEPISVLIGSQQFALRKNLCQQIFVEEC
jgi:Fe2+ transport system protein FeoA